MDTVTVGDITYNGYKDFRVNPKPRHRVNETDTFTLLDSNWGFAVTSNSLYDDKAWTIDFYYIYIDSNGISSYTYSEPNYCNYSHFPIEEWSEALKYSISFSY